MNQNIDQLQNFADITSLRPALHSLCSRYGAVVRLDILAASQAGKRQALCFLRMDSPEHERQLMCELGIGRFAGDLVVVVDLCTPGASTAPTPLPPGPIGGGDERLVPGFQRAA